MYDARNLPAYGGRTPPAAELIVSGPIDTYDALSLLTDLDNTYPPRLRPRTAGLLLDDGQVVIYLWPYVWPDSALAFLLTEYGGVHAAPLSPGGRCWLLDDELPKILAARMEKEVAI